MLHNRQNPMAMSMRALKIEAVGTPIIAKGNDESNPALTFRFKRRELKHTVPVQWPIRELIERIHNYYPVAPFKPGNFPTVIQTTWCETPDWLSLREYLEREEFRYKLRIRRYRNGAGFSGCAFVELKTKTEEDKLSRKFRFKCPPELIPELFNGVDIIDRIGDLNEGVKYFDELYHHVRSLIIDKGFKPLLRAEYSRAYFQKTKLDPVRLTLDGFVTITYLPDLRTYTEKFRVLEAKIHEGSDMDKLDNLLNAICANRERRFSKYHRALKFLEPELIDRLSSMI